MTPSRWLIRLGILTSVHLFGCSSALEAESGNEEVESVSEALTNDEVLGFESLSGWSATAGTLALSTARVQGDFSLAVSNVGYTELTSAALSSVPGLAATGSLQLELPTSQPNPWWYGSVDLRVDSPSRGVYGQHIQHWELTGLPLGSFQELAFTVPSTLLTALSAPGSADIRFIIALNVPSESQVYRFDALTFGDGGSGECNYSSSLGTNSKKVRLVYLVPSDKSIQPTYIQGLERGAQNLQVWWKNALPSGKTFTLSSPLVEVYQTAHDTAWYSHVRGSEPSTLDFWFNLMDDAWEYAGAYSGDPNNIWLVYLDADTPCGGITGAVSTFAGFPANDLRGLAGQQTLPTCPGDPIGQPQTCRWVGGMGHELGHALGLPHPSGCEPYTSSCADQALMWMGYTTYPNAYFTSADLTTLDASPFLATESTIPSASCDCADLN
jgi:hypothetical protein